MLTKLERKLLSDARSRLVSGHSEHICMAIGFAAANFSGCSPHSRACARRAGDRLRRFIMDAIYPHTTLHRWLYMRDGRYVLKMEARAARIAWIDWMLDEPERRES